MEREENIVIRKWKKVKFEGKEIEDVKKNIVIRKRRKVKYEWKVPIIEMKGKLKMLIGGMTGNFLMAIITHLLDFGGFSTYRQYRCKDISYATLINMV